MKRKFKLSITSFDLVGGVHYYGSVYLNGVKIKELAQPAPNDLRPKWLEKDEPWDTIKFHSELDVVSAAKKWFLLAPEVSPGDILVVWSGYFTAAEIKSLRFR